MQPTQNVARVIQGATDTERIDEADFLRSSARLSSSLCLGFVFPAIIINHVGRSWLVKFSLMILILPGVILIGVYSNIKSGERLHHMRLLKRIIFHSFFPEI